MSNTLLPSSADTFMSDLFPISDILSPPHVQYLDSKSNVLAFGSILQQFVSKALVFGPIFFALNDYIKARDSTNTLDTFAVCFGSSFATKW
jgi:hypothetical protein